MLDVGWSELLLIGIVALIVVGPEDLPRMFNALGRITARARSMAREFSRAMEDAAKSSGLDDATKTLRDVKSVTSKKALGLDALDRAASSFEKWDPKRPVRTTTASATTSAATPAALPDPAQPRPVADPAQPVAATPGPEPVMAEAPAPVAPPVTPAPGRRQLRATRRSDGGSA